MNLLNLLYSPNITISLQETGKIMLPITATILGLAYAALIYWLQGGFSKLEYSKSLLEDLLIANARILLDLLVGASIIGLFAIFEFQTLISISFWIFSFIFLIDLLKETAEQGYFITLFSKKFIPSHYGVFRAFIRKIRNAGLKYWIRVIVYFGLVVGYPLMLTLKDNLSWTLSDKSSIIFIFFSSTISLLQIKTLLTVAFDTRKQMDREMLNDNEKKAMSLEEKTVIWSEKKRTVEEKIITERLKSLGIVEAIKIPRLLALDEWTSRNIEDTPVIEYRIMIQEHGNCHLNLIIPYLENDILSRDFIFMWTKKILIILSESKSELQHYSLSFFRKDDNGEKIHFAMFRAQRSEIKKAISQNLSDEDFVKSLQGKYLSLVVADI